MATETNDLSARFNGLVSVTPPEHPDDRSARIKTEARQSLIADSQNMAVFVTLLVAIIAVAGIAGYEGVLNAAATADTKRWAQTVLSAILTGGISFVVGRNSRR